MKKKILSLALTAGMLLSAVPSLAAVEQTGDNTVLISGSTGKANTMVGVQVFADGKKAADLKTAENWSDVLVFHDQCQTDEKGDYKIYADLDLSGKYKVYVGLADGTELDPEDIVFVSGDEFGEFAENVNDMTSTEIEKKIEENPYVFGYTEEDLEGIDKSELAKVLEETLKDTPISEDDRKGAWEIADKALFVQKLNESKIDDIFEVDDEISALSKSEVAGEFDKAYVTDALIKSFTERLNGQSFASYEEYTDSITEAFVLAVVENPNGSDNVKNIMTKFDDEIGIDIKSTTPESTWNKLSGNDYSDYADLKTAFNKYAKGGTDSGSSGSSSSNKNNKVNNTTGVGSIIATPDTVTDNDTMLIPIFDDIDDVEWAKPAIVYLTEKQILDGVGGTKFNPNGYVTREQLAKMVVGAFAKDAEAGANVFADVDASAWYAPYVLKAYAAGIVNGMGDGSFGVGVNVTRQDMCVMIYNAAKANGYRFDDTSAARKFEDDGAIADYAKEAVYALREAGAVNGMDSANFAPYGTATRAQVAKIIYYIVETM